MPIYEYKCMKCNKDFEYLVLGNDTTVSCPECNGNKVKRQISTCSFKSNGNYSSSSGGSSGCATCSSGSCATCH
jgi:putative FmdB family regulatory protein